MIEEPGTRGAAAERSRRDSTRRDVLLVGGGLVALVAAVYAQVRGFGFLNLDDQVYVYANLHVMRGLSWEGFRWAFGGFHAANWHPLTWLSHMADVSLFGADPGPHHLINVALHALDSVLLFAMLRRATGATWRSGIVAALFAVHPLHVESVAWISERKDVLSTCFLLLAMLAYLSYVRRPRPAAYLVLAALFALGLMAKAMVVTLPFLLLLLDAWPLRRLDRASADQPASVTATVDGAPPRSTLRMAAARVFEKLPLFALAAAASAATYLAQSAGEAAVAFERVPLSSRAANALVSYVTYLGRTAWPAGLCAFYPHPALGQGGIPPWKVAAAAAVLVAISAVALRERARRPYLLFGWLWYLGTLVPVIGIVQVGGQALADRYTYVPLVGIFVAVVWAVAGVLENALPARRAAAASAAAIVPLAGLALVAHGQAATWRDSMAVHARALAVTHANWNAWNGLGDALSDAGRPLDAIDAYREALRIRPDLATAWNGLGAAFGRLGQHPRALEPLRQAVRLRPSYADAWYNLGTASGSLGDHAKASECFRAAVRADPEHARAWANLGIASLLLHDTASVRESYERLRVLDPTRAEELLQQIAAAGP